MSKILNVSLSDLARETLWHALGYEHSVIAASMNRTDVNTHEYERLERLHAIVSELANLIGKESTDTTFGIENDVVNLENKEE